MRTLTSVFMVMHLVAIQKKSENEKLHDTLSEKDKYFAGQCEVLQNQLTEANAAVAFLQNELQSLRIESQQEVARFKSATEEIVKLNVVIDELRRKCFGYGHCDIQ